MFLGAAGALLTSACAASVRGTPIGMSDAVPDAPAPLEAPAPRAVWPDFAAARAWPEAAPASVALAHRRDGTLIHVRVEPAFLAAYRELAAEAGMPEGARVVAWHEAPSGALLGGYLLAKRSGAWTALELDANGGEVGGDRSRCVRCHDMAATDHLFGSPSAPPPAPLNAGESIPATQR